MKKNKDSTKVIMTLVVVLLVLFYFYRNKYFLLTAGSLGLVGISSDYLSGLIASGWIWLAGLLGKIMPKIILFALYFLFFTPYSLILKMTRKNPLDLRSTGMKTFYKERNHRYTKDDLKNPW